MNNKIRPLIKNGMSFNLYLYDSILNKLYRKFNLDVEECINALQEVDSIADFRMFRQMMLNMNFPPIKGTYTIKRSYSENSLYGYAESLLQYAGISNTEMFYFPVVVHGVPYEENFDTDKYLFNNSFIFQGSQDSNRVLKVYPHKKVYCIGPYLYYVKPYYTEEKTKKIKTELGKTALIFLSHSQEELEASVQVKKQIDIIRNFSNEYRSFLVCVYCQDVNQITESDLSERDVKYVSAGYKLDAQFCSRLRTIIELSDDVYFDGFSSSIGYAYLLKKNIYSLQPKRDGYINESREDKFKRLFCFDSNSTKLEKQEFIDNIWGISEIKEPGEVRRIYEENKKRIQYKKGFFI